METIFSSKLYKTSKRKDKIQAALGATANLTLVQQLATSLDDEYKTPKYLDKDPRNTEELEPDDDLIVDEEVDPENDLVTIDDLEIDTGDSKPSKRSPKSGSKPAHRSSAHTSPSGPSMGSEEAPGSPSEDKGSSSPEPAEPAEADSDKPTEASTSVTSSQNISLTVIKESLNSRADTCGVARVAEKESEIWIYYNDGINLNNIMTDVIEYLINAGYASLEFNRLARSDNAIVFQNVAQSDSEFKSVDPSDKDQVLEDNNLEGQND